MRSIPARLLPLAAFALTATAAGAAPPPSVEDFRLPQGEVQPPPDRQGPVAPDVPESRLPPRPEPTSAPQPVPTTTPAPAPAPRITLPQPSPAPNRTPTPSQTAPAPAAPAAIPTTASTDEALPAPPTVPGVLPEQPGTALPNEGAAPASPAPADEGQPARIAGLAALALIPAALLLAWLWRRRRRSPGGADGVPVIERPRGPAADTVAPAPQPAPSPAPQAAPQPAAPPTATPAQPSPAAGELSVDLHPVRMSMTLVNAVLAWRLDIANRGGEPLEDATVALDIISAHKDLTDAERQAGPADGSEVHPVGSIAANGVRTVEGELRLPFPRIVPIWHGETPLLLPLVRLRISARGLAQPVTRVVLVGQPSARNPGTLQPFRLDLGPRVYPELDRRAFA